MDSWIFWNCRGLRKKASRERIRELLHATKISMLLLVETHVNSRRHRNFIRSLGRSWTGTFVAGSGLAGGLLAVWKSDDFQVNVLHASSQIMHLFITNNKNQSWLTSLVYGSNCDRLRNLLWDQLSGIDCTRFPWLLIGDFNVILSSGDKKGGKGFDDRLAIRAFNDFVFGQSLQDLGFTGPSFTWCNNRRGRARILIRLDRAFGNSKFTDLFPNLVIKHLHRAASDHAPLLLNFDHAFLTRIKRFKFEHFWFEKPELCEIINNSWITNNHRPLANAAEIFASKLSSLQWILNFWNWNTIGSLEHNLQKVTSDISMLESKDASLGLTDTELDSLRSFYNLHTALLRQISLKWQSKARMNWLMLGDSNSAFFHKVATIRRKRNSINYMLSANDLPLSSQFDISSEFVRFYTQLWSPSSQNNSLSVLPDSLPQLSGNSHAMLTAAISCGEIQATLRKMASGKAPGPDGFHVEFYKYSWETISSLYVQAIQDFQSSGVLPPSWCLTHITFIPKVSHPVYVKDFRPIALCNVSYRLLAKVLASRLALVINDLVGREQSAFIRGRSINDNILLVQEIAHSISCGKRNKSIILLKLDIEKAFDKVCWASVLNVLRGMNFPEAWVGWVGSCISSPWFSCLINGELSHWFKSTCGVRQGDPLSPLLFILVMQVFTCLINDAVIRNRLTPFRCKQFRFSHALYADDLIVSLRANSKSINSINRILAMFSRLTGLNINKAKSAIYFSSSASLAFKHTVCSNLDISSGSFPFKYLGAIISDKRVRVKDQLHLIEKARSRLAGWKADTLSQAGRLVLIRSVLQAIPVHTFLVGWSASGIIHKLEQLNRSFFWKSSASSKGMALIKWSTITLPKFAGGLGVKDLRFFNTSLLAPCILKILNKVNIPWVNLACEKYGDSLLSITPRKCSWAWRSLCQGFNRLQSGFTKKIGNGSDTSVLHDPWVFCFPLSRMPTYIHCDLALHDFKVCDFIVDNCWNFDMLSLFFGPSLVFRIGSLPLSSFPVDDSWVWASSTNGLATPSYAYRHLQGMDDSLRVARTDWCSIWKLTVPPKVKLFLWKFCSGVLPTGDFLCKRNIIDTASCAICSSRPDTDVHIIFDCPLAAQIWSLFRHHFSVVASWGNQASVWFGKLIAATEHLDTCSAMAILMWTLWTHRNNVLHNQEHQSTATLWAKGMACYVSVCDDMTQSEGSFLKFVKLPWCLPPHSYVKINADASFIDEHSLAGGGWICRDTQGLLVEAGGLQLAASSPLMAEALALKAALDRATSSGWTRVWAESDSTSLIQAIVSSDSADVPWVISPIVLDIRSLADRFISIHFEHVCRDANKAADWLASLARHRGSFLIFASDIPVQLGDILEKDVKAAC